MATQYNWAEGERVRFDDGIEQGEGAVRTIAKLGAEQHLWITWDDGVKDQLARSGSDPALSPVIAAA